LVPLFSWVFNFSDFYFEQPRLISPNQFKMELCECSTCARSTITNANGQEQPGQFITRRASLNHRIAERNQKVISNPFTASSNTTPVEPNDELVLSSSSSMSEASNREEHEGYLSMTLPGVPSISHPLIFINP